VPGSGVSCEVGGRDPVAEDDGEHDGGRSWSVVCALGVLYVVVVADDVVNVLDVALLGGVIDVAGGSDESSDVRITAKISTPTSSTAAAPAANTVPGLSDHGAGSSS